MSLTFKVIDSGSVDRSISAFQILDPGSVDRTIVEGRIIGPDGNDRVFYDTTGASSFGADANFATVYGSASITTITTSAVTVTVTGGTPPYFHAWTVVDHTNTTAPTVNSPSAATTAFTQTNVDPATDDQGTFLDTVTDSASNSAQVFVTGVFLNRGHESGGIGSPLP